MPGDVINAEVYAKYVDTNTANWQSAFSTFMGSIAGGTAPAGTVVDGGSAGSLGGGTYPITTINHSSESGTAPKAYLNYLVFGKDMTTVLDAGFIRITTASREYGQNVAHEKLEKQLTITEPGYVYIYLSNENATAVEVYFDDFDVEHVKSPVVQVEDYYVFGLTFNSHRRENSSYNRYQFNGKEIQNELGLGWNDFGARMYMSDIGRWGVLDPLSEKGRRWSPYTYAFDNPIRFIDPDGMWPELPSWNDVKGAVSEVASGVANFANGAINAVASNNTTVMSVDGQTTLAQGFERGSGGDAYSAGQTVGDVFSVAQGVVEGALGLVATGTGGTAAVVGAPTVVVTVVGTAVAAVGVAATTHGTSTAKNGLNNLLNAQGSGQGRGKNNRQPDSEATGDHTVSNGNGSTTYETNTNNPTGFQEVQRDDTKGKAHNGVDTPHVHEDGEVRPATPNEIPKTDLSKNK